MFDFYTSYVYSTACIRTQNKQLFLIGPFVKGTYKYRLRFIATIQSDNNTDNSFDREVARINLLRTKRQRQLVNITRVEAAGRRYFIVVIPRNTIEGIDLDTVRLYKIRLSNTDNKDIDTKAERRSVVVPELLRLIQ